MKLTYVCTNYNNSDFTIGAVESLMKCSGHELRVFIVDNASRKEDLAVLQGLVHKYSVVRLIQNKENVGYFAGLNIGISAARHADSTADWFVIGNNDLEFGGEFCDRLEGMQAEYINYSVVSPDIVTLDGQHQNPHVIEGISPVREFFYDLYYSNYHLGLLINWLTRRFPRVARRCDVEQWKTSRPIYQGHGSCYVLTPKFFGQFSQLWSPTFMMSEEFFLSLQLKDVGEQVFYSPAITVKHHWHGSLQSLPSRRRWKMAQHAHRVYRKYVKTFSR